MTRPNTRPPTTDAERPPGGTRRLSGPFDLGLLAAGGAASGLLARWLPPELFPPGAPLGGTVAVIPAALAALAVIARRGRAGGGRRLPPRVVGAEAVGLVLWLVAACSHRTLGLSAAGPALAAGLFGLLGLHAAFQVVALRPLLAHRNRAGRGTPSILFFALPLVVYCTLLPWSLASRPPDGDEPYYLLLTHSLAYDQDVDLADDYAAAESRSFMDRALEPQPGDPRGPDGAIYSRHDPLMPTLLALPYRLGGRAGAAVAMATLAAALAWVGLSLARRASDGHAGGALLAYAVLAFTPPLLLYAQQIWVEVPAALAAAVAYERLLAARRGESSGIRLWLPLGAALAALPFLKIRFALIAGPLALLVLAQALPRPGRSTPPTADRRPTWKAVGVVALLAASVGTIMVLNRARFGNALKVHSWRELDLPAFSATSYVEGLLGLFWDVGFGLFFCAPVWLLVVPAMAWLWARHRRLAAEICLIALPYLVLTAPRAEWYGGWSPPFRYGVVLLPLLAAALAPLLTARHRPGARAAWAALGLATAVLTLVWVVLPGWTYDLADGGTRLLDALSASLGADAARFFPSFVRPRAASWIWPPVSAGLVLLLWWWPRRLPARGTATAFGTVALLGGLAALPTAARHVPSRVVELEDPWVEHRGGHLYPETWIITRTHYRAGWVVRPFEEVRVPLVPGGDRVTLELEARLGRNNPDPLTLEVVAADGVLATWTPEEPGTWTRVELGPFDWPPGGGSLTEPGPPGGGSSTGLGPPAELTLRAVGSPRPGRQNGLLLDRMEVRWQ